MKRGLFYDFAVSGEGNRENATEEYGKLESTFVDFSRKYSKYRPLTIKFDGNYTAQMNNISEAISGSKEDIHQGNLSRGQEETDESRADHPKDAEQIDRA